MYRSECHCKTEKNVMKNTKKPLNLSRSTCIFVLTYVPIKRSSLVSNFLHINKKMVRFSCGKINSWLKYSIRIPKHFFCLFWFGVVYRLEFISSNMHRFYVRKIKMASSRLTCHFPHKYNHIEHLPLSCAYRLCMYAWDHNTQVSAFIRNGVWQRENIVKICVQKWEKNESHCLNFSIKFSLFKTHKSNKHYNLSPYIVVNCLRF